MRLFIKDKIKLLQKIILNEQEAHYLKNVLRCRVNDHLRLFNAQDGEYSARIYEIQKKCLILEVQAKIKEPLSTPSLKLAFAPLKNDTMHFLIEKATELGVTEFYPLVTEYTQHQKINEERLYKISRDAAQQSERFDVPYFHKLINFNKFLANIPKVQWICALERCSHIKIIRDVSPAEGYIIGPEGGFSPNEKKLIHAHSDIISVHLGQRILRAETAAIVCLSQRINT